jgi:hypothetical protein
MMGLWFRYALANDNLSSRPQRGHYVIASPSFSAFRFEIACHSERSEESRPGPCSVNHSTQSEIPRSARNDISWVPGVRPLTNISDCLLPSAYSRSAHPPTCPSAYCEVNRSRYLCSIMGHYFCALRF